MFDVSFVELLVIGVVALLVLGPERLPAAARTVGNFVRKARQTWQGVRTEFEREIATDELKRSIRKTKEDLRSVFDPLAESKTIAPSAAVGETAALSDEAPAEVPARGPAHPPHD